MGRRIFLAAVLTVLILGFGFPGRGGAEERYVVKPGDSLYAISKARGVSIEALKRVNHLRRDQIKLRQVLLIPTPEGPKAEQMPPAIPDENGRDETPIDPGWDPLQNASEKVTVSVQEVKKAHPLPYPSFQDGQELIVHTPSPYGEEEELRDGSPLPAFSGNHEEEAKESPAQTVGRKTNAEKRSILVRVAKTFLGVPYRLGGSTLRGIDCSALVKKIYGIFEISLPRTAREQFGAGKSVDKDELAEGDLVFFKTRRSFAGHVGIYIGRGEFVHASSYQRKVKVDRLDAPYFSKRFLRGVRVEELEREI
jgi:cell wall-associated NlpC family hydrolase